ncbi:MAG: hypothetical protein JHC63_11290 [Acidimicrobiia bacterium]|nr:hypothetical protein [Acidimicrobiia bacterium]
MSSGNREGGKMMCEVCGETLFGTDFCQGCGAPVSNDDAVASDSDDDTEFELDDEMQEEMTDWP